MASFCVTSSSHTDSISSSNAFQLEVEGHSIRMTSQYPGNDFTLRTPSARRSSRDVRFGANMQSIKKSHVFFFSAAIPQVIRSSSCTSNRLLICKRKVPVAVSPKLPVVVSPKVPMTGSSKLPSQTSTDSGVLSDIAEES
eukprot:scpid53610/ scgid11662/ 